MSHKIKTLSVIIIWFFIFVNQFTFRFCKATNKNAKIIIIGAGPSGIAAASKLLENGFLNVTILEAEDRIGGRVFTTKFGNYTVDLGGQWVHGIKGNIAYELANPYELLGQPKNESTEDLTMKYFDSDGNSLNDNTAGNFTNFYEKYVEGAWFGSDSKYESHGKYIECAYEEEFKNNSEMMNDKEKFLNVLELFITGMDPAESWYDISTLSLFEKCEGTQLVNWKERGYSTILDILMKRYPDDNSELPVLNNTIFKSEVKSIDYSKNNNKILITTVNEQTYEADHVIVTVSLGVLKEKHDTLFIPKLPDDKAKAIKASGFGSIAKIFLLFNQPFWLNNENNIVSYNFFWNEKDRKLIEKDPEKSWLLGLSGVHTVEYKPNLLELWISGKYTRQVEILPEDKVIDHSVENLHRFLDKIFNVTQPIAMLRTNWTTNPHFRGTYSYRSVEAQKKNISADVLERPIDAENLKILFAGETTSMKRYGTVDGAIASGWKAARRLINFYNDKYTTAE